MNEEDRSLYRTMCGKLRGRIIIQSYDNYQIHF